MNKLVLHYIGPELLFDDSAWKPTYSINITLTMVGKENTRLIDEIYKFLAKQNKKGNQVLLVRGF